MEKIEKINYDDYVYDLEVKGTHTFFANGILVHNTDSVFVKTTDVDLINKLEERISSKLGLDLSLETKFRYVILSKRKKNYLGVTEGGDVIVKGLLGKKRNIPPLIQSAFKDVLQILVRVRDEDDFVKAKNEIKSRIKECVSKIKNREYSIENMSFKAMLSKAPDSYVKTTPQHVKAAKILEARKGIKLGPGDIISYVKTRDKIGVKPTVLANKNDLDTEKYIEILKSTFTQVLDAMDIDFDEILGKTTLERFF